MGNHDNQTFTFPKRKSKYISPLFSRVDIQELNSRNPKPQLGHKSFVKSRLQIRSD